MAIQGFWQNRIWLMAAAFLLDLLLGDPRGLPHPVQGIGALISRAERLLERLFGFTLPAARQGAGDISRNPGRERLAGALLVLIVLGESVLAFWIVRTIASRIHPQLPAVLGLVLSWQMLACRSLREAAMEVYRPLVKGDLEAARTAVSMIVGRDTARLDQSGITKAAVETVAENASDGVIAPLFWLALLGPYGILLYKAVNTMDSMVGYRNERYRYFGTAAARLDDLANYLPSRLAALLLIAAAWLLRHLKPERGSESLMLPDPAEAWRIWRRDRRKHPSPNSAQTESACAGALHLQLAGDAWYFGELHHKPTLGDADRPPEPEDIPRACRLMMLASALTVAAAAAVAFAAMAPAFAAGL